MRILTKLVDITETLDRRVAAITTQRGLSLEMPVNLPVSSQEEFSVLEAWLQDTNNQSNLVSKTFITPMQ